MAQHFPTGEQESIGALVADIVHDGQKLVRQEILLARTELQHEWVKLRSVSLAFGAGLVAAGIGALFLFVGFVLLVATTGFPLWASFGVFALAMLAAGIFLLLRGKTAAQDVELVPRQTMESVKENVKWFKNRIS